MIRLTKRLYWPNTKPNTKRISREESERIAKLNPGPGIPMSMLPPLIQERLRNGETVSAEELDEFFEQRRLKK